MAKKKPIKCKLYEYPELLDKYGVSKVEGFSVENGKRLYWWIVWNKNHNAKVCHHHSGKPLVARNVKGDVEVTIHFK